MMLLILEMPRVSVAMMLIGLFPSLNCLAKLFKCHLVNPDRRRRQTRMSLRANKTLFLIYSACIFDWLLKIQTMSQLKLNWKNSHSLDFHEIFSFSPVFLCLRCDLLDDASMCCFFSFSSTSSYPEPSASRRRKKMFIERLLNCLLLLSYRQTRKYYTLYEFFVKRNMSWN